VGYSAAQHNVNGAGAMKNISATAGIFCYGAESQKFDKTQNFCQKGFLQWVFLSLGKSRPPI